MHKRQEIRETIYALLVDSTLAEDRVYKSKYIPHERDSFPNINIYTPSETCELINQAPPIYKRNCILNLELVDKLGHSGEDLVNVLDTIAEEVEQLILIEPFLGIEGVRPDSAELASTTLVVSSKADVLLGVLTLEFNILYYTQAVVDETKLENLEKLNVDQENYPYEDLIEFDQ